MKFQFLEHTADLKVNAFGRTIEKAFINSALALKEATAEKVRVKPAIKKEISVKGKDLDALLYNFLEEFIYLIDAEDFLLSKINKLSITHNKNGFTLASTISGDKASSHKFTNDVKAITYNEMFVKKAKDKFIIQFVLDV
jgi:SHS2 domain-containing protein